MAQPFVLDSPDANGVPGDFQKVIHSFGEKPMPFKVIEISSSQGQRSPDSPQCTEEQGVWIGIRPISTSGYAKILFLQGASIEEGLDYAEQTLRAHPTLRSRSPHARHHMTSGKGVSEAEVIVMAIEAGVDPFREPATD